MANAESLPYDGALDVCFHDFDRDGDYDLVVAHHQGNGIPDRLWRNDGLDANGLPI